MSNMYSLIAELIVSNAAKDAERSKELIKQLYFESIAVNAILNQIIEDGAKLQPSVEKESTSLN